MSKTCAICGEKIPFMSDNSLSKEHKDIKICFTCYEYAATAMKGNKAAVNELRKRYRDDISEKIVKYIDSLENRADFTQKKQEKTDEFMDLMSNDLSKVKKEKQKSKTNIIRLDKLSDAKKDKLIRVKIVATIMLAFFILFGLLFSFYLLTQGYGTMLAVVMAVVSVGFAVVFYSIKSFLSVLLDE